MTAVTIVKTPEYLAKEIDAAHREVLHHGKSILAYAAKAGECLIAAKGVLQHGEFKPWIERNCAFSYKTAAKYMKVAKSLVVETFDLEAGVDAFLGYDKPSTPHPTPTELSQDDASHALKLQAMVERGATEGERDVARRKLEAFAKGFGHTAEALVAKAEALLPDWEKSSDQIEREKAREELAASQAEAAALRKQLEAIQSRISSLEVEISTLSREELVERYIGLVLEREGLTKLPKKAA